MKRIHLIVSGYVQGVGYRGWFRRKALNLGLTGWVSNREDGAVEAVCEGEEEKLLKLIEMVKVGPEVAEVEDVRVAWGEATKEFEEFIIKFD